MTRAEWDSLVPGDYIHGPYSKRTYRVVSIKKNKKGNELTLEQQIVTQEFSAFQQGKGD
jgi:hypothetical protein